MNESDGYNVMMNYNDGTKNGYFWLYSFFESAENTEFLENFVFPHVYSNIRTSNTSFPLFHRPNAQCSWGERLRLANSRLARILCQMVTF